MDAYGDHCFQSLEIWCVCQKTNFKNSRDYIYILEDWAIIRRTGKLSIGIWIAELFGDHQKASLGIKFSSINKGWVNYNYWAGCFTFVTNHSYMEQINVNL